MSFSFSISLSNEYSGWISFRTDWLALLAVQDTLKSLQHDLSALALLPFGEGSFRVALHQKAVSLEKTLMLGKIESRRRRGQQRLSWLDDITDSMDISFSKLQEIVKDGKPGVLQSMGSQRVTRLSD